MDDIAERIFEASEARTVADQPGIIKDGMDATPEFGGILDDAQVGIFGEGVEGAVAALEQVKHLNSRESQTGGSLWSGCLREPAPVCFRECISSSYSARELRQLRFS